MRCGPAVPRSAAVRGVLWRCVARLASLGFGEDRVQLAPGLVEHLGGPLALVVGAVHHHLAQGVHRLRAGVADVVPAAHRALGEVRPRRGLRGLGGLRLTGLGDREPLPPAAGLLVLATITPSSSSSWRVG